MARVLFHVDINAFFASAEEIKNPNLKEFPLAIGSLSKRGVLSTANYEARKYGIHSSMPVYEALRLCPDLIIVQGDYAYYRSLSQKFFQYLKTYTTQIEIASIDECYMDVTDIIKKYKRPLDLAFQIQNGVHENLGLNVSIGVAPNRFLAKMASDMRKPRGITVLRKSEIERKLWPMPIDKMFGIGRKTIPLLIKNDIKTIGDLAKKENEKNALHVLGNNGFHLIQNARGNGSAQLNFSHSHKSISISKTFQNDLYTIEEVITYSRELLISLSKKMIEKNIKGKMISLTLRDTNFHNIVRSATFNDYTNSFSLFFDTIQNLIDQNFEPVGYRYIGIHIGSLKDNNQIIEQPDLFTQKLETTNSIVETLNKKMHSEVFFKASDLLKKNRNMKDIR